MEAAVVEDTPNFRVAGALRSHPPPQRTAPARSPSARALASRRASSARLSCSLLTQPPPRPPRCAVRVRPLNARELGDNAEIAWKIKKNSIVSTKGDRECSLNFGEQPSAAPLSPLARCPFSLAHASAGLTARPTVPQTTCSASSRPHKMCTTRWPRVW